MKMRVTAGNSDDNLRTESSSISSCLAAAPISLLELLPPDLIVAIPLSSSRQPQS
jgi:hypothetical protein